MTEEQIELAVERAMDRLDRQLMAGIIDQDQYDEAVRDLDAWAESRMESAT